MVDDVAQFVQSVLDAPYAALGEQFVKAGVPINAALDAATTELDKSTVVRAYRAYYGRRDATAAAADAEAEAAAERERLEKYEAVQNSLGYVWTGPERFVDSQDRSSGWWRLKTEVDRAAFFAMWEERKKSYALNTVAGAAEYIEDFAAARAAAGYA